MIKVDRSSEAVPAVLARGRRSLADRDWDAGLKLMQQDVGAFRQRGGPLFRAYRDPSVREALHRVFKGKCAYCESRIGATQPGDIEQYRPKGGVLTAEGTVLPLHYWWLANDWDNLLLSCIDCNRVGKRAVGAELVKSGKGGRFPLEDESQRASVLNDIDSERPLLIDPCRDDPAHHLVFSDDGVVVGATDRGHVTIEILGLNRKHLVEARRRTATRALGYLRTIQQSLSYQQIGHLDTFARELRMMMEPDAEYAGMARQIIWGGLQADPDLAALVTRGEWRDAARTEEDHRRARASQLQFRRHQEAYSLEDGPDAMAAYVRALDRRVQTIVVRNFRAIGRLNIRGVDDGGRAPWLMLLGENASGKSTVLQAVALALIGDNYRNDLLGRLGLNLGGMVRAGAAFGEVSVSLSGTSTPRTLRIYSDGRIEVSGPAAQLMVLGYGSTRLLPRAAVKGHYGETYARIENLFDPFIPLIDAQGWLLDCSSEQFDYAASAIKVVLGLPNEQLLERRHGQIGLVEKDELIPLAMLCDGYQTVIALVADVLAVVLRAWSKPDLAQGLVLIDEVGNHLHPSWKIRFVDRMREILPGIQVIATTHEPLCLRGLRDGEVVALRRGPRGGVHLIEDLPSIEGMRIDQILTSEHFGLQSTLDPQLQASFDRYHQLLRHTAPSQVERDEIDDLRKTINVAQKLGNTERERRLLDAIDRFLAERERVVEGTGRTEREARLDLELAEIWKNTLARVQ